MKLLRKLLKVTAFSFLVIISAIGLYLFVAFVFSRIRVKSVNETTCAVSIFILSNGIHTDIVVPVKTPEINWNRKVRFEAVENHDTTMRYLAFGWGNKAFYLETPTWANLKFKTAFDAVFGFGSPAIHTTFYETMEVGADCIRINMSKTQYLRLIHYIDNSFVKDVSGNYEKIKTPGYGYFDAFYDAKGHYNLFYTCNTWTNDGLKISGQKACLWTPFAQGIFYQYKNNR